MPVTKGVPDVSRYLLLLPLIVVLWPPVLYFHGLYQIRRGRSLIDETFAILFSVLLASALTLGATLYVRVYYRYQPEVSPLWEYSQAVFALFVVLDVLLLSFGRAALRSWQERQWAAGENLTRVLVAGTGELGRTVAEALVAQRHLGYRVIGFLGESETSVGHAGLRVVGTIDGRPRRGGARTGRPGLRGAAARGPRPARPARPGAEQRVRRPEGRPRRGAVRDDPRRARGPRRDPDHQPQRGAAPGLEQHGQARDGPAVLGAAAARAQPGRWPVLALLVRRYGGKGPVLLRQERMTLDGKTFQIFKFRTMVDEAEKDTGPIFATSDDPRRTKIGAWLRKHNLDELPQLLNVLLGDMSLVGPRPERPPFVQQFRERIPQYMRRHRVKSGMTGWAQVNGWRGNTSIEKRIEFDLYYIENWSLRLDLKILILTLFHGFGQDHAY